MTGKTQTVPELPAEVARAVKDVDRLAVLHGLEVLDTAADPDFDRVSSLAAAVMQVPMALVTLVDLERQWFKSCFGLDEAETATDVSFCAHAI
ncbi:histidine kinase, partial [Mesorhizobium sp. M7A.F.Ca.CA.004.12.1.1]